MFGGCSKSFDADDSFENSGCLRVFGRCRDDSRAVDKVDAFRQSDVLPDLGLSWNRCDIADLATLQSIDHAAFADIGVSNKAD